MAKNQSLHICITGASAGIGAACAMNFARQGHHLYLGARRIESLCRVADQCKELGAASVVALPLDVGDMSTVEDFAAKSLASCHGRLDVLINNAGLALGSDHVKDGNIQDWETVVDVNVMGVMRVTRAFLPSMVEQKSGHIIFMSSIAAHQPYEGGSVYAATKHAVKAIAFALKLELIGTSIRCSTIDPGMVETEFSEVRFRGDREKAKNVYRGLKPLTADDIADCVSFVVNAPPHVNIDQILLTPTAQASVYKVARS